MGVVGLDKLAGLDMLVELGLGLVGAALELAELELVGVAALELAGLELVGSAGLVGPAGIVGVAVLEVVVLEVAVFEVAVLEVAVLEAAELVAFVVLGPDLAGLSDLPEPAQLPLAQLALGNGAEHCSKLHSSAKEVSEADQLPD